MSFFKGKYVYIFLYPLGNILFYSTFFYEIKLYNNIYTITFDNHLFSLIYFIYSAIISSLLLFLHNMVDNFKETRKMLILMTTVNSSPSTVESAVFYILPDV